MEDLCLEPFDCQRHDVVERVESGAYILASVSVERESVIELGHDEGLPSLRASRGHHWEGGGGIL